MPATIVQIAGGDTGTLPDAGAGAATSYTLTLPQGTTAGNQLFLLVNSNATVTTPSGFAVDQAAVFNSGAYIFRKTAVAGETSWVVSPTSAAGGAWVAMEVSGLSTTPLDKTANGGSSGGATTSSSGTTAATTQADEFALAIFGTWVVSTAVTITGLTNSFVEQHDRQNNATGTNDRVGMAVATKDLAVTGAVETTATFSASSSSSCCIATYFVVAVPAPPHALSDRYWRAGKPVRPAPFAPAGLWPPSIKGRLKGGG